MYVKNFNLYAKNSYLVNFENRDEQAMITKIKLNSYKRTILEVNKLFNIIYWIMIILFTSLHIQELMKSFSINLSYFITTLVIVVIVALVSRKFNLETKEGPILWRVILGCIQLVILFINFISETVWGSLSLFIIFIGLEWFRHIIIKQFKDTHNKL